MCVNVQELKFWLCLIMYFSTSRVTQYDQKERENFTFEVFDFVGWLLLSTVKDTKTFCFFRIIRANKLFSRNFKNFMIVFDFLILLCTFHKTTLSY